MILKKGVKILDIQPETVMCCIVVDGIYKEHGRPEGVTITSVVDGKHSDNSLHYTGFAIDTRTRYFNKEKQQELVGDIRRHLTDEFDVILEKDHCHIEFDPR